MDFVKQYLRIINYILMGLTFGFASFYLIVNVYHYLELRKDFIADMEKQPLVINIDEKINHVSLNISSFDINNYKGNIAKDQMSRIYNNLNSCVVSFNNPTYQAIKEKDRVNILDVYHLRESYEDVILSNCIINGLYWTTSVDENFGSQYLFNNKDITKLYINSLLGNTSYVKKDLMNNSSYFFNTAIASASSKDNTRDGFYEVLDAYNRAASFVEYMSNWFKTESEVK